ncbi:hypothetical protein DFH28DRAFT_634209 [Melampsora americana]|nr:hypothetical protein DFH28DRAFT_634209 [Melampsora americana]
MMMINDDNIFNEINDNESILNPTTTNHHHHDLPSIESWIDFSECAILHQSSQFIKSNSNQIQQTNSSSSLELNQFIKPTFDHSITSPSISSSLTSPFCDQASFLTLSPPPISLNDPLPITRTEYGLIDEFWSQIATTDHSLRTEEEEELLRLVVEDVEVKEALGSTQSITPTETVISPSRIDPLLLSVNELHPSQSKPSSSSSSSKIKSDQVDEIFNGLHPSPQHHPPHPIQSHNECIGYEGFEQIPKSQSPTQSIISSTHSSIQTQFNSSDHPSSSSSSASSSTKKSDPNGNPRGGKRKDFLERNRLAASRSRAKRKQTESLLESRARVLEDQNLKLRNVVQDLEIELRDLKRVLLDVRMMN